MFFLYLWHTLRKILRGELMGTNLKLEEIDLEEKYGLEATLLPNEFLTKMNFLRNWLNN